MGERDLLWVFVVVAWAIGVYLLVYADRVTERSRDRAARAREKYGHRPKVFRPQIANARPSKLGTRLTGLGFFAIGGLALVQRLV